MLIKNAEIHQSGLLDLRIDQGIITEIGHLPQHPEEVVIDAYGGALLPGLNDHHIHFLSYAASLASIDCSPANVSDARGLAELLESQTSGPEWLRGFGYHESVAGDIDYQWLDRHCPDRPLRIQHRTGRLWIFNSAGLRILKDALSLQLTPPLLPTEGFQKGRFYDADQALAQLLGRRLPPVKAASEKLASYGITGFSDMTPSNDQEAFSLFHRLRMDGSILQKVSLARQAAFVAENAASVYSGPVKIHLHESRLPPLQSLVDRIRASHDTGVAVAIHCVTEVELMVSLTALEEAGSRSGFACAGDRIEHASVTPEYLLERIRALGLTVVTQPHFVSEKGDTYLRDVEPEDHGSLYRCRSFLELNIPLAGSSDAPFGGADPWTAMRSAIQRQTSSGKSLGCAEALTPEQALELFLGSLQTPGDVRRLQTGMAADLCLLRYPWSITRTRMISDDVRLVLNQGQPIFSNDPTNTPFAKVIGK